MTHPVHKEREFWSVGDRVHGAGTPTPGKPYWVPTANEKGEICQMLIVDIELDGPRHYWGTVTAITPVSYLDKEQEGA